MQRFWDKVDKNGTCWLWLGAKSNKGYGLIHHNLTNKSHRLSWILTNGPIPNNLHVLHKCDNPSCVNPDHLFLGTPTDNVNDMNSKNRGNKKLSDEQVKEIKLLHKTITQRNIAKLYNVSQTQIWRILNNDQRKG